MKGKLITDPIEALKAMPYEAWFSDAMIKQYFPLFNERYQQAKEEEKESVLMEMNNCIMNYAVMTYYVYGFNPNFRKAIDGSREYSSNFKLMKSWLDDHNGRKIADGFVEDVILATIDPEGAI